MDEELFKTTLERLGTKKNAEKNEEIPALLFLEK
jgi:hypothetical protein